MPPSHPVSDPSLHPDHDVQEQEAILQIFLATVHHYFGSLSQLFASITDPRQPAVITYPLAALLVTGLLLFVCHLGARRQVNHKLRGNQASAAKFETLFGVSQCPHGDTLAVGFSRLHPADLQAVISGMTETLIRRKVLAATRLLDHYYLVAIDGTGVLVFSERHCAQCLTRTDHGVTTYYHPVLEAKLVTATGFAFSLMTEFIENPAETPTKQDCELKAFYRLAARLKQRFPRLPICLLLDGLYAGGPTFTICEQAGWKYLITLQDGDLPSLHRDFEALLPLAPENHLRFTPSTYPPTPQELRWMNDLTYVDTQQQPHTLAVINCRESRLVDGQPKVTQFRWVCNFKVTSHNVLSLTNQGGRLRWKIENEGFNVQKTRGYALEHALTQNPTAAKVFYFLLQIAHLLNQLMLHGSLFRQAFPHGVGSAQNLAWRLLEAWRNVRRPLADLVTRATGRFQIRFDSS
ncbi:MAG: transposase family protein [Chloroflexi bacterium]|nr:transposase family protein [Chloroflexota bacterium]